MICKIDTEMMDGFVRQLHEEEKSKATIEKYVRDVNAFMEYANSRELSHELVLEYKNYLLDSGRYKASSINTMLASINSYLKYIDRLDCRVKNIRIQRCPYEPEETCLEEEEYKRLRKATKEGTRLRLILETIFGTGIRVSELAYFTVESLQKNSITVKCKKKIRVIIVSDSLRKRILAYAKKNGIKSGVIFRTKSGKPVDRSNIWAEMKRLCEKAHVAKSKVFPHNLRKLFARLYYNMSKNLAHLADLLGHSNFNTTRIYIMTTEDEVRGDVETFVRGIVI